VAIVVNLIKRLHGSGKAVEMPHLSTAREHYRDSSD
jgi:hypothetical protein